MTLQLRTKPGLWDLHCSVGLTDWDMDKELKLATTTDQFLHDDKLNDRYVVQRPSARASRRKDEFTWYDKASDTFVKPSLWLWVNPNIVCPGQLAYNATAPQTVRQRAEDVQTPPPEDADRLPRPPTELQELDPHRAPRQEEQLPTSTSSTEFTTNREPLPCPPAKNRRKGRTTAAKDCLTLKPGCWPRPPVNYYILIALALMSNHNSGLKVQQIYHFTRENFPFFQTAPDGWKNSIRHNLCFNSSFSKTCNQLCRDGKRKSCFWHLTLDGQRRLRDEIGTLPRETLGQLERSMSHPEVIRTLLAL